MSHQSSTQPDHDDHSSVLANAAAAKRENQMLTQGAEPLSLWVVLGSAIVMVLAGGVLFSGGNLFDYDNMVKKDYVRSYAPGEENTGPKSKPAMEAYMTIGSKMFSNCIVCHKENGKGDGVGFPPLANSEWVNGPSLRPAMVILNGLKGPISVEGKNFGTSEMIPQTHIKGAKELASVLNYIRNSFGNKNEKLITVEMAQQAFDLTKKRGAGKPMSAEELNASFNKELEGPELDPTTPVNPKTLKPAK